MTMKEEKPVSRLTGSKENVQVIENGKKKPKDEKPATKVVVRRLPPTMTEEQFKMQVSPLPDFDYFYFVSADMSLSPNAFSRAYINFLDQSDLFIFTQKFDGYVFIDSKGGEFPAIVEFAPFQRIPKNRPNRKKDPRVGTIEANPVFIAFKERLETENLENKASASISKQHFFETSLIPDRKEASTTPLLDYIKNRRAERQRIREEKREEKRKKDLERRKAKEEQRRSKREEDASVVKTPIENSDSCLLPSSPSILSNVKLNSKTEGIKCSADSGNENNKPILHSKFNEADEKKVPKKVYELVQHFNNTDKNNKKFTNNKNKHSRFLPKKCLNHLDIEQEILKKAEDTKHEMQTIKLKIEDQCFINKNNSGVDFSLSNTETSNGCKQNQTCYPESSENMSNFPSSNHTVKTKIIKTYQNQNFNKYFLNKINPPPIHQIVEKGIRLRSDECNRSSRLRFAGEIFKKNLLKVVPEVLRGTKSKSPREKINKSKHYVRGTVNGIEIQNLRQEFNSKSFRLGHREFLYRPVRSVPNEASPLSCYQQKPMVQLRGRPSSYTNLPSFSCKSLAYSKSAGGIDQYENFSNTVLINSGRDESHEQDIKKRHFFQKSYLGRKKSHP